MKTNYTDVKTIRKEEAKTSLQSEEEEKTTRIEFNLTGLGNVQGWTVFSVPAIMWDIISPFFFFEHISCKFSFSTIYCVANESPRLPNSPFFVSLCLVVLDISLVFALIISLVCALLDIHIPCLFLVVLYVSLVSVAQTLDSDYNSRRVHELQNLGESLHLEERRWLRPPLFPILPLILL